MTGRDDFSRATKRSLAARVGYVCSKPGCTAATVGPSDDAVQRFAHTGDAAHITAASEGGPRWDSGLTPGERRSEDNGIWLCTTHAKLVDANSSAYPRDLLQGWKRRAEELAGRHQEMVIARAPEMIPQLRHFAWPPMGPIADAEMKSDIRVFFEDVGAGIVIADRDYEWASATFIELAHNAARYEAPGRMTLEARPHSLELRYPSKSGFGLADLLDVDDGEGGSDAVTEFDEVTDGRIELNYLCRDGESIWILTHRGLGRTDDPCSIDLDNTDTVGQIVFLTTCRDCEHVNMHVSRQDSLSDNWKTARYVKEVIDLGRPVTVHAPPGAVADHLRRTLTKVLGGSDTFQISEHV